MKYLSIYITAALLFLMADLIWLHFVKSFYAAQLGGLMRESPILWAGALVYILYPIGLVLFILEPGFANHSDTLSIFIKGVFFGILVYATYDLTNLAIIKDWPIALCVVDILWGGFVSGGVACATFLIFKRFFA